jgi:hypothetical protein
MASKEEELAYAQKFLRLAALAVTPEPREEPDFLLNVETGTIGLEICKLLDPGLKESREAQRRAARIAQRALGPDPIYVFLGWRSNDFDPRNTARAGQQIPDAVRLVTGGMPAWEALKRVGLDDLLDDLIVSPNERTHVGGLNMYEVGAGHARIQAALSSKEEKLPKYKSELPGAPMWLLLASGIDCSDVLASGVGDKVFTSGFDQVFILSWMEDELRELRVASASL